MRLENKTPYPNRSVGDNSVTPFTKRGMALLKNSPLLKGVSHSDGVFYG